ncbi:MAG: prolyl oligopeptidase family serine peptidase [Novosphingobium sp.]|uniref:prolyl oligopeptidase family serine peptidase n=1 Tax=Novosphingobium sp. TaxID=1874826 RepID=UPI0030174403
MGRIGRAVLVTAAVLLAPGAMAHEEAEALAAPLHGLPIRSGTGDAPSAAADRAAITTLLAPRYPATRRDSLIERQFGEDLADPYRWLEADVRASSEVAGWVAQQNAASSAYLAQLPGRDALRDKIRSLFAYERFSLPRKAGSRYFYTRNSGLQNQAALYVREGLSGEGRLLVDPNGWQGTGDAGLRTLDAWVPSPGGRLLAFSQQRDGSDWRTIRVVDVGSGRVLEDRLEWANDTAIGWVGDAGFLYARYPEPPAGEAYRAPVYDKAIWFHRIGTPQSADVLVFSTPDHRDWNHRVSVSSDGRWAVILSSASTLPRRVLRVIPLARGRAQEWAPITVVPEMTSDWKFVEGTGDKLWFVTNAGAPHYRLVRLDLDRKAPGALKWSEVVGEKTDTLDAGRIVGDRLVLSYLQRGSSIAVVTDLRGRPKRAITVDAIGSASGFGGRPGDPETFYQFSSFNQPPAIYRLDLRSGAATPFAVPHVPFNPEDYLVEQRSFTSKDGTRVPMYLVRKRSLAATNKAAPTLLYGYGGFDVALTPGYSAVRMAWLEAGGVFALANIRGGGEFGRAWYDAGRLANKQNSFDDFIAAGEYLVREGIAAPRGLAIQGGSNGGMLVAAVINQRPDLFAAANPDVGVMDMLRFDRFTTGRFWTDDYGSPSREADWRVLRAYSPYHNIRARADYPAILVTTADTDDRVVPAHSFKYVAALQAAEIGARPHLLRVEAQAGHGPGKPVDKVIASGADVLAFLAKWTGLALE